MVLLRAYTQTVAFLLPKNGHGFVTILRNHFLQDVADFSLQLYTHVCRIRPRYVPFFAVGGGVVARGCSVAESRDCQLSGRAEEVRHTHCMRSASLQSRHGNSSKRYVLEHRHAINIAKEHFQCTRRMGTLSDIARVREIDTASR